MPWDWLSFLTTLVARIPIERVLFPPPDRTKELEKFATTLESTTSLKGSPPAQRSTTTTISREKPPETPLQSATAQSLPTREETTAELQRRLARELYKAELDLSSKLRIAGKPCDCLDDKHTLGLEATAEELIAQEPSNPVYSEIIGWIKDNRQKVSIEAITSGKYDTEYPKMAAEFKDFRKRVMGTAAFSAFEAAALPITLDEAKKLAAEEAAKRVEEKWPSQEKK